MLVGIVTLIISAVAVFNHQLVWLQPRKDYFHLPTARQVEVTAEVVNTFPKLIDPNNEMDQADPYIVAMGVELNEIHADTQHVVVTLEKQSKTTGLAAA